MSSSASGALSRRELLAKLVGVAAVAGPATAYAEVDRLVGRPRRIAQSAARGGLATARLPEEQYRYLDLATVVDGGVAVLVPPLHRLIVTATLDVPPTRPALQRAAATLESRLAALESSGLVTATAAGCGLLVGWGLEYFGRHVRSKRSLLPVDLVTSRLSHTRVDAVVPAREYTSDTKAGFPPPDLEANEVVFVLGSDDLARIDEARDALFGSAAPTADLFRVTSERRGFVDARHVGGTETGIPKARATSADLPGAAAMPASAELFLGFTSTQGSAMAPGRVPSFETLPGFTNQWPSGYFRRGTAMSLSHLYEDLASWYGQSYDERLAAVFSPRLVGRVPEGAETVPADDSTAEGLHNLKEDAATAGVCGHSTVMQPASRTRSDLDDRYGRRHLAGTPLMLRADVNTLDAPFAWSPDGPSPAAAAGVHFVAFTPTSAVFDSIRSAMDGQLDGVPRELPTTRFTDVLRTTHRQNFLVPPRAHRSFPLAELL